MFHFSSFVSLITEKFLLFNIFHMIHIDHIFPFLLSLSRSCSPSQPTQICSITLSKIDRTYREADGARSHDTKGGNLDLSQNTSYFHLYMDTSFYVLIYVLQSKKPLKQVASKLFKKHCLLKFKSVY